jgi:hypothetical protein
MKATVKVLHIGGPSGTVEVVGKHESSGMNAGTDNLKVRDSSGKVHVTILPMSKHRNWQHM